MDAVDTTSTTGSPFQLSERGKAVVIEGDAQYNEIVATNQILRPYRGSGGTVSATIYSDAVAIRNFAVERLATHPQILESNRRLVPISEYQDDRSVDPWYRDQESRRLGEPYVYRIDFVGGSRDTASEDAVMVIHVDPIPTSKMTIEFDIIFRAANLGIDALSTPQALPIHESVSPDTFQRLIEAELVSSSLWGADDRITKEVLRREELAMRDIQLLPRDFGVPMRSVGTKRGY